MEFCDICDNMLNLKVEEDDSLIFNCKSCNTNKPCEESQNTCVYKSNYGGNEKVFYELFINKYTFDDPTLPKVNNIQCPNLDCECNKKSDVPHEVIYVRYNDADMKYIYLCCNCKLAWICPEYQKIEKLFYFDEK